MTRILQLLSGSGIASENSTYALHSNGHRVDMHIVAGIGPPRQPVADSGWYIYCNGRLVVRSDRSALTGWGTAEPGGDGLPAWHGQYARFRGYVFLTSDFPAALPWATTKTEIDTSSDIYVSALGHMQSIIRHFANFTNELTNERSQTEEAETLAAAPPRNIENALNAARLVTLDKVPKGTFRVPMARHTTTTNTTAQTEYHEHTVSALTAQVNEIRQAFGFRVEPSSGEAAFERFYEDEIN